MCWVFMRIQGFGVLGILKPPNTYRDSGNWHKSHPPPTHNCINPSRKAGKNLHPSTRNPCATQHLHSPPKPITLAGPRKCPLIEPLWYLIVGIGRLQGSWRVQVNPSICTKRPTSHERRLRLLRLLSLRQPGQGLIQGPS